MAAATRLVLIAAVAAIGACEPRPGYPRNVEHGENGAFTAR